MVILGGKVSFFAKTVYMKLGLKNGEDEYGLMLKKVTEKQMLLIKKDLAFAGTEWIQQTEGQMKLARSMLKPLAKVWYHILRHKLTPTTHLETMEKERLVLLHCILKEKETNMGDMIKQEISTWAMKKMGNLIFPCLIIKLCLQQGIEYNPGEGMEKNSGPIGMNCILILFSNSEKIEASASKM